jgi:Protein of unknown function (DUF2934)
MAKTTKQVSGDAGESVTEPVKRKATSRKVAAKKAGAESQGATKTGSTKKAAAKESVATKPAAKKAAPRKKVAAAAVLNRQISSAERRSMIAEAAYLRGESQGFLSDEAEDWLLAEAEVDNQLIRADVTVND